MERSDVYKVIDNERDYQDTLYPTSETNGQHTIAEFILYMEDYITEARHASARTWGPQASVKSLDIIRKITALGVACMEQNGAVMRHGNKIID